MTPIDLGEWQGDAVQPFPRDRCPLSAVFVGGFIPIFLSASRWSPPWSERGHESTIAMGLDKALLSLARVCSLSVFESRSACDFLPWCLHVKYTTPRG